VAGTTSADEYSRARGLPASFCRGLRWGSPHQIEPDPTTTGQAAIEPDPTTTGQAPIERTQPTTEPDPTKPVPVKTERDEARPTTAASGKLDLCE
jgi:hypothetical protein